MPEEKPTDMNALARLFTPTQSITQTSVPSAQLKPEASDASKLGSAGIMGGTQLLSGILSLEAQKAAAQKAMESDVAKQQAETQAEGMIKAQQAQQDAFGRLMANYRQALV